MTGHIDLYTGKGSGRRLRRIIKLSRHAEQFPKRPWCVTFPSGRVERLGKHYGQFATADEATIAVSMAYKRETFEIVRCP